MLAPLLRRRWFLPVLLLVGLAFPRLSLMADEDDEEELPPPIPFAVVNLASVERSLTDIQYVCDIAERPELMEIVNWALGNIKDLKGIDRTRPAGAMFFLESGLPPTPFPVIYLPVEDEQALLQTLTFGDNLWKKSGTDERRYRQVKRPKMHLQFRDGYAFLVRKGDWVLDEELPDPVAYNDVLTSRYDIAAALRIGSIPQGIRQVFTGFLRASSEAELQRRDDEPEVPYRFRRANGLQTLEFFERLLLEGDQIILGLDASMEKRKAVVELTMEAQPDSQFAEYLTDVSGTQSLFYALADDTQPLTISGTWKLNDWDQKAYREYAAIAKEESLREMAENEPTIPQGAVANIFDAIDATLADGQIDISFQFVAPEADRFVILAVAKIVGARTVGASLTEVLTAIRELPDNDTDIDLSVDTHHGVVFHRLEGDDQGEGDTNMFGGKAALYIGASDQAVWMALGKDPLPELKHAIDLVRESAATPRPPGNNSPLNVTLRMNRWMQLVPQGDRGDRKTLTPPEMGHRAFAFDDDDALRITTKPTENGARVRMEFDESYLRFIGIAFGSARDSWVEDQQRRQQDVEATDVPQKDPGKRNP